MNITITVGWWLLPLSVTVAAFVVAYVKNNRANPNGDYGTYGVGAIYTLLVMGGALIVSLTAWLIWSIIT